MSRSNCYSDFWRYVDSEGKMPQLRYEPWDCEHFPYYVRYVDNRPVAFCGPVEVVATRMRNGDLKFYDYSKQEYVPANGIPQEN
jgi:hypothetical protein